MHNIYIYRYTVILIRYSHSVFFSVGWFAGCPEPRSQGAARQWQANDLSTDGTDGTWWSLRDGDQNGCTVYLDCRYRYMWGGPLGYISSVPWEIIWPEGPSYIYIYIYEVYRFQPLVYRYRPKLLSSKSRYLHLEVLLFAAFNYRHLQTIGYQKKLVITDNPI